MDVPQDIYEFIVNGELAESVALSNYNADNERSDHELITSSAILHIQRLLLLFKGDVDKIIQLIKSVDKLKEISNFPKDNVSKLRITGRLIT